MILTNNSYLYNFILSSSLVEYNDKFQPILDLDSSICMYLFQYSKDLLFSYPYIFTKFALLSNSYLFFNICCNLLEQVPSISSFDYTEDTISFSFLDRFSWQIYNYKSDYYYDLYSHNELQSIVYNGLCFNILPIEAIIAYCIQQYNNNNKDLQYVTHTIVLSSIYQMKLMYNNILSNLLLLNLNIKSIIKQLIKDIKKINTTEIPNFHFTNDVAQKRTLEILEFCYG